MAEMHEPDIIEALEKVAAFELPAGTAERDIETVRKRLTAGARPPERNLWRTIMESKWTRLTSAAAVLAAAVLLGSNLFVGRELTAAELLKDAVRNMEKVAWVKTVTKRYVPDETEPVAEDVHWTDVRGKRVFAIYDGKYVHLMDYNAMVWSVYRPETNDMVVKPLEGDWTGPAGQLEEYLSKLEQEGIAVTQTSGVLKGRKAIIVAFEETLNYITGSVTKMMMGGKYVRTIRTRLFIYEKERQLAEGEMTYLDGDGGVIVVYKSVSEVSDSGPSDIHELGAPKDAAIINKVPERQVQEIRDEIDAHRAQFLKEYIAVITEARIENGQENVSEAFVVFCNGKKLRVDQYRLLYGPADKITRLYAEELSASVDRVKQYWTGKRPLAIGSVRFYDGLWQYVLDAEDGKLKAREKQRRPDGDLYGDDDIDDFGWRKLWWLGDPEHLYEDDYSRGRGLVGMELTAQADSHRPPKRLVLYVDPQKDYVCHRYLEQNLFDAPWQEDKDWLASKEDKNRLAEEVHDREVVEYGRTSAGQWYPKVITEKGHRHQYGAIPYDIDRIIRIHLLEENPRFPEGIFDPASLPKVSE